MPFTPVRRVLYIEDDVGLARLLQRRLAIKNIEFDIATTGQEGLDKLREGVYDVILLDHFLPDMNGMDMLDVISAMTDQPPVILLTASGDERLAVLALEKGAADYAVKDVDQFYIELLPAIMQAAYTRYHLMIENRQQRVDLEKAREKAEAANQAKSEFLATMSHEIRTPLNVILGIATLMQSTSLNDRQKELMSVLNTNATVLLGLVNDILDLSRVESGQMALEIGHFDVQELLNNMHGMFKMHAARKQLDLQIDDKTIGMAWDGDALRIQQIVMNLVSNAIKFTETGFVRLRTEIAEIDQQKALKIVIEDSGIGIDAERLPHIFNKFVQADQSITRRFGGSGLGLALSQSLAEMMGGEIKVCSQPGKGSEFSVILPLPARSEAKPQAVKSVVHKEPQQKDKAPCSARKILLVEDYPANVMIATMMLENMGYETDVASSGQEAVDHVKNCNHPYYAILMDIQMHGMDGFEATRQIRALEQEKGFSNYIIGATAHALSGDRERCLSAGMDDYISKPIDWNAVGEILQKING